jgi:chitinase
MATIQPGYVPTPFDWRLHVRCDDPKLKCPCGTAAEPYAYTTYRDLDPQLARIDFCLNYFGADDLKDAIKYGSDPLLGPIWRGNLESYLPNKGISSFLSSQ